MEIKYGNIMVATFALAFISVLAASAPAQDTVYGAIAYSPSTGKFGSSWNNRSPEAAERQAMAMCKRDDCRVLMPLANNCGALAVARNGGYEWSTAGSLYEAKLRTSNRCTQKYGGCKLICSVCSSGNEP